MKRFGKTIVDDKNEWTGESNDGKLFTERRTSVTSEAGGEDGDWLVGRTERKRKASRRGCSCKFQGHERIDDLQLVIARSRLLFKYSIQVE
jgi:hypothetical protein